MPIFIISLALYEKLHPADMLKLAEGINYAVDCGDGIVIASGLLCDKIRAKVNIAHSVGRADVPYFRVRRV